MNSRFILQRLAFSLLVILGVTVVVFLIIQLVPGDPARVSLGQQATEENLRARRERLGLNRPIHEQYVSWITAAATGDLGRSLITNQPIGPQIIDRLPTTLQLAGLALLIGMLIAFPLGILSALRPGTLIDAAATITSQFGVAVPDFWMAILLVVLFSTTLGWLPPSGYTAITDDFRGWLEHMILPAMTAGFISASIQTRFIRSAMLETLRQNYVITARAKGLRERVVVLRHSLPNALITITTILGLQMTALLSAVVVIEIVFVLPGLGSLTLDAVKSRDYPLVQGTVLVMGVLVTAINLGVDLIYFLVDPRIAHSQA
jgi:peptide/nickel transport system permease protein